VAEVLWRPETRLNQRNVDKLSASVALINVVAVWPAFR
jgi:hypothetical protein